MLFQLMLDQLVLAVILDSAAVANIRFMVSMPSNVVVSVANRGEALATVDTAVGLLSSMNPHVDDQVSTFVETLGAERTEEGRRYVLGRASVIQIFLLAVHFL